MLFKRPDRVQKAPADDNLPPGQFLTSKLPVLTYGATPEINLEEWELQVSGLVKNPVTLSWEQFKALRWDVVEAPFHCVTQWSRLENTWEGLLFTELCSLVEPEPEAKFIIARCYGGYSTNLPVGTLLDGLSLLAHKHDGKPLTPDHGWPLRLVAPQRYGWKSAKWVHSLEFSAEDQPGFWEIRGYHNEGDPWKEERFWPELV